MIRDGEYPPNIELVRSILPIDRSDIVFSYFPDIYNPSGKTIYADLMIHEEMHLAEQERMGVDKWWHKYLHNKDFRFEQEIIAFAAQYAYGLKAYKRKVADKMLSDFALSLSDGIYGKMNTYSATETIIRRKSKEYGDTKERP